MPGLDHRHWAGLMSCECGSAETGLACFCCVTCGLAWCDWLGEHPAEHTCNHGWTTGSGPDDPADTGVHRCACRPGHDGSHECKCRAHKRGSHQEVS